MVVKNKNGFMSILIILILSFLIPFTLFIVIDLPYAMTMNRKIKNTLDNAASTAVTCVREELLSDGIIEIKEEEAIYQAERVIIESFYLNDDLSSSEKSLIGNDMKLDIKVFNHPDIDTVYKTENGTFKLKNASVLIYAEVPVKLKVLGLIMPKIKYTAISQAQFK